MMLALLAFQFDKAALRRRENTKLLRLAFWPASSGGCSGS
jgi:hypothetical protein